MSWRGISIKTVQKSHLEGIVCRRENKARQKSRIYQIRESLKQEENASLSSRIQTEELSDAID